MTTKSAPNNAAASKKITKLIKELGWAHDGGVCTGESYKQVVKLTFFQGASLLDPQKLFNSSLEGNTRRAIDIREGEKLNEAAFQKLIRSAVAANSATGSRRASPKK